VLLFAGIGLSMFIRLLLPTKSFRRTLINHFISKIVHDLFFFREEFLANGPRVFAGFSSAIFLPNFAIAHAHKRPELSFWH